MIANCFIRITHPNGLLKQILCVCSLLLITACAPNEQPLRVAMVEWPPYELSFWARHQGWLDHEKVELLEYKTPSEVARAFASEAIDIAALTTDFALSLSAQHPDTRIFLVIDASNGGDAVLSRQSNPTSESLRGKTIALEAGPLGNYMLSRFLNRFELERSDLTIEYVDIPQQVDHWQSSDVDLLITYEPSKTRLIEESAQVVFTSKDIPNEVVDVFLVRESVLKSRKDDLAHFSGAWFKAVNDLHEGKSELLEFIGVRESIPVSAIKAAFEDLHVPDLAENQRLLSGQDPALIKGAMLNEQVMRLSNMLSSSASVDMKSIVTASIVKELD